MNEHWRNPCYRGDTLYDSVRLGGTGIGGEPDSWCPELWDWLIQDFQIQSMVDVGCGLNYVSQFFNNVGVPDVLGIDGYAECYNNSVFKEKHQTYDFYGEPLHLNRKFDLIWTCDVLEHIDEDQTIKVLKFMEEHCNKVLAFTAAPPGVGGYHHVNCQPPQYWINRLTTECAFDFSQELTDKGRELSPQNTMGRGGSFFGRSGLIFLPRKKECVD